MPVYFKGLKFLVRICTDLGLKDVQDYAQKLKKAEKAREMKQQVTKKFWLTLHLLLVWLSDQYYHVMIIFLFCQKVSIMLFTIRIMVKKWAKLFDQSSVLNLFICPMNGLPPTATTIVMLFNERFKLWLIPAPETSWPSETNVQTILKLILEKSMN